MRKYSILIIVTILFGCNNFGDEQNQLYGIIYRDKKEVSQFRNYEFVGASVIDTRKNKADDYEFGITHFTDSIKNILIFEKFIKEENNPQPKYQILDTINIDNIKADEYITYCNCLQDMQKSLQANAPRQ